MGSHAQCALWQFIVDCSLRSGQGKRRLGGSKNNICPPPLRSLTRLSQRPGPNCSLHGYCPQQAWDLQSNAPGKCQRWSGRPVRPYRSGVRSAVAKDRDSCNDLRRSSKWHCQTYSNRGCPGRRLREGGSVRKGLRSEGNQVAELYVFED